MYICFCQASITNKNWHVHRREGFCGWDRLWHGHGSLTLLHQVLPKDTVRITQTFGGFQEWGDPITGWFIVENLIEMESNGLKWMMTGGTPHDETETTISSSKLFPAWSDILQSYRHHQGSKFTRNCPENSPSITKDHP